MPQIKTLTLKQSGQNFTSFSVHAQEPSVDQTLNGHIEPTHQILFESDEGGTNGGSVSAQLLKKSVIGLPASLNTIESAL